MNKSSQPHAASHHLERHQLRDVHQTLLHRLTDDTYSRSVGRLWTVFTLVGFGTLRLAGASQVTTVLLYVGVLVAVGGSGMARSATHKCLAPQGKPADLTPVVVLLVHPPDRQVHVPAPRPSVDACPAQYGHATVARSRHLDPLVHEPGSGTARFGVPQA